MKDCRRRQAEGTFEIQRTHDLPAKHRRLEIRAWAVDEIVCDVGNLIAMIVPGRPLGRIGATCWQNSWPRAVGGAKLSSESREQHFDDGRFDIHGLGVEIRLVM